VLLPDGDGGTVIGTRHVMGADELQPGAPRPTATDVLPTGLAWVVSVLR
jgi:hypothetical protein